MSSTPAPRLRYRWTILAAGVFAQAANSAVLLGLPAIAPAIRQEFALTLPQVGVVLAAVNFGAVATLLVWGIVADRIGERAVIALCQMGAGGALVWAAYSSSFGELVAALSLTGALGAGVNAASGRAVMSWFAEEERGFALGIRQMAVPLGGAVAAVTLPALDERVSLGAAFDGLAAASFAAAAVGALLIRTEPAEEEEHSVLARPLRDPRVWRICIASTFYVTTQLSLLGFFVLFLHDHRGVSTTVASGAFAVTQVLGGIARIVVGRLSDRLRMRIVPLRWVALALAASLGVMVVMLDLSRWIVIPALVVAGVLALSWNGLSFTAAAEAAGRARSGAALGLQQTFLSAGAIVAPIAFASVVHAVSWRAAFLLAALSPLVGYALLRPLAER
ncbi:MAG TPA: MFS transporter [Gaiellaceae bacterium]|nr:MFS transporter [Gaiellaceae bacterium]